MKEKRKERQEKGHAGRGGGGERQRGREVYLPQVAFEPTTFCILGRRSTNRATKVAKLGRPNLIHVG